MRQIFLLISAVLCLGIVACDQQSSSTMDYKKSALLIIDMQYDFMEGGSLEVKQANSIVNTINQLAQKDWGVVVASKDWHPQNHVSFASNNKGSQVFETITLPDGTQQVMWPDHCVQGSHGSEIHKDVDASRINHIVLKGQNPQVDSYSAFFDNNHLQKTDMEKILKKYDITTIYVVGLARDYCVRWTALDGQKLGYKTYFVWDATKPVDPSSNDAIAKELKDNKVEIIESKDLL